MNELSLMNITPHTPILSMPTVVNPPTESLRRENQQREVITQVTQPNHSAAEKGVASDKDRAKTPAQAQESIDFTNLRKQAEQDARSIGEKQEQGSQQDNPQEQSKDNPQEKQQGQSQGDNNAASESQSKAEEKILNELQQRDQEVRKHELAHARIGGAATGSPSYTFEVGPDGKRYAVGGEVSVDLSEVAGDPQATIIKMQKIHAAALAPVNPSVQDTRVAASAAQIILQAQSELLAEKEASTQQASHNHSDKPNSHFSNDDASRFEQDFDTLINQTLAAQESIAPSTIQANQVNTNNNNQDYTIPKQSLEVSQRALRIESFYQEITEAYDKPSNYQFELTA